ncbi:DNA cytosine methyltransferase [Patulibacter brassicae]|uniref:Cytosine-specific methyltransferase n=1 Tax=Patulibacter brassicae TaxID=1705717 RepID=A0ABU4VJR3_9ACTN|nr:DNA cytosine methyltransferase [Patulibacter brassicae]MDX8152082.1 DNA cytosine methyltransferase [Patulibacter brassicae]
MRRFEVIDLFAGCGGMTLGFVQSERFEPVFAVELDRDAADTYELNFGPHLARDGNGAPKAIEDVEHFPAADVVIGGPPCQGFSALNMRGVSLERRGLWRQYLRALEEAEPVAFVMENVPELLKSAEYADFKEAAESELGFTVEGRILNAADYGVPQTRRRAIVIGSRIGGPLPWPTRGFFPEGEAPEGEREWRTFKDAVAGLSSTPTGQDWHDPRNPTAKSLERYRTIPNPGENRFDLAERRPDITPRCWLEKKTGSTDVFGRLWWDRPAVTIRTEFYKPEKGRYLHPEEHRPITVREAARCMTFPDAPDFVFPSRDQQSMTSVARQIGNAVPPLLARTIAEALAAHLADAVLADERALAGAGTT